MKSIFYSILAVLTIILSSLYSPIFGQTKWGLPYVDINIPVKITSTYSDNVLPSGHSSDTTENISISTSYQSYLLQLKSFSQDDDIIDVVLYDSTEPWLNNTISIHFVIDTTSKKIKDFSWSFSYDDEGNLSSVKKKEYLAFRPMNYTISDSALIVNENGMVCLNNLDSNDYTYEEFHYIDFQNGIYYSSRQTFDSLLQDTASYRFVLTVISNPSKSEISARKKNNFAITILTPLPDHSTHFSFPYSPLPKPLLIYDILGRAIKRIEIPSGVSEYRLEQGQLPSGYYFARLGNMGAKFAVW